MPDILIGWQVFLVDSSGLLMCIGSAPGLIFIGHGILNEAFVAQPLLMDLNAGFMYSQLNDCVKSESASYVKGYVNYNNYANNILNTSCTLCTTRIYAGHYQELIPDRELKGIIS